MAEFESFEEYSVNKLCKEKSLDLFFEDYLFQMLAAATSQMVHPLSPIFDDSLEHFEW